MGHRRRLPATPVPPRPDVAKTHRKAPAGGTSARLLAAEGVEACSNGARALKDHLPHGRGKAPEGNSGSAGRTPGPRSGLDLSKGHFPPPHGRAIIRPRFALRGDLDEPTSKGLEPLVEVGATKGEARTVLGTTAGPLAPFKAHLKERMTALYRVGSPCARPHGNRPQNH